MVDPLAPARGMFYGMAIGAAGWLVLIGGALFVRAVVG